MAVLKFLWFLVRHLHVRQEGECFQVHLQGLQLVFDPSGDVQVQADRDLRVNARYLLAQCTPEFDPELANRQVEAQMQEFLPLDIPGSADCGCGQSAVHPPLAV